MTHAQLKALVKKGESEKLEFKNSTGNISSGMQTVCAFLNSDHGGAVIFGVTDNGKIVGQEVTDKTRKDIAIELNKIEPRVKINVQYVEITKDRKVIVLLINPGEDAPYTYDGRAFVRNQSTTMRMLKEEYMYIHNINNPALWESLTSSKCTIKDLDRNRIKAVVRAAVSKERLQEDAMDLSVPDLLRKLKLMAGEKLINAAVILFCKNEEVQFFQSNLKLARFRGIDKSVFLDMKSYNANAFDLYDKAMDFLVFNLPVAAWIEQGNPIRVEEPAIPYRVLREALVNALIHRDYSYAGGSLNVAVYDDRVEITNMGTLPKGIMLQELSEQHPSIPRNPLIADVFFLYGKIEKWGRGTLDMIRDCKKAGNPIPIYKEIGGTFSITLPLKEPLSRIIEVSKPTAQLTDRQKEIVDILKHGPLKTQELMNKMSENLNNRMMQRELAKLKKMGIVGPADEGRGRFVIWKLNEQ